MAEQELKDIIQQAWCDGDSNPKDKFGDFLNRAAKRIKEAGWKSPEEIAAIRSEDAKVAGLAMYHLRH